MTAVLLAVDAETIGRSLVLGALALVLANGYWFAWWPLPAQAQRVFATDSTGGEIANVEVDT